MALVVGETRPDPLSAAARQADHLHREPEEVIARAHRAGVPR
ncbi:hypothetical protein [Nonomuraea sp. B19D2]